MTDGGLAFGWAPKKMSFKTGDMFPGRARRLLGIGFKPPPERDNSWHGRHKKLKAMSRDDYDEIWKDPPLERWVELQQVMIKFDALADDRKILFQEIEFIWENRDDRAEDEGTNQNSGEAGAAAANANAGGEEEASGSNDSSGVQQKDDTTTVVDVCMVVQAAAANDNEQPRQDSPAEIMMI